MAKQQFHIVGNQEDLENHRFQSYVQSVAFHMTLSKAMISMLGLIRDYGWPLYGAHEEGNRRDPIRPRTVPIQHLD